MDTFSASVSSLNLPSLPPQPQPPVRSISRRFQATVTATASSASTNLSKPTSSSYSHNNNPNFPTAISFPLPQAKLSRALPPPPVHEKAASGFAATLVCVSQSKNCLGRTQKHVRRLMEFVVGEENRMNKVFLVNDVVESGKFGKHLKGLVKILIARGKTGILFDVLMEFERICNELVVVGTT